MEGLRLFLLNILYVALVAMERNAVLEEVALHLGE
jgi:hypothetical protein